MEDSGAVGRPFLLMGIEDYIFSDILHALLLFTYAG